MVVNMLVEAATTNQTTWRHNWQDHSQNINIVQNRVIKIKKSVILLCSYADKMDTSLKSSIVGEPKKAEV